VAECFIHPHAVCETRDIGDDTRIWAFAYVLEGATIGSSVNVCSHAFIEGDVVIGDRVTIKGGVHLYDGVRIEDGVFIGPGASFANDVFPRGKEQPEAFPVTRICQGASIGANATILPGVTIGRHAMVGAGAVVTRSVPPNALVVGNPARIDGYVDTERQGRTVRTEAPLTPTEGVKASAVSGVTAHRFALVRDIRGSLVAEEFGSDIPFEPRRSFLVFDVPSSEVRGEHAHRECHQFLVCIRGACSVVAEDGRLREEFRLDHPTIGIYIPPMVWCTQFNHTPDAMLLVFASHHYDGDDYIRDYQEYLKEVTARG
jgi:UDP-2-acetamido-3-amino-2,3-dideoxy-glucuronate N-acetyltransferase